MRSMVHGRLVEVKIIRGTALQSACFSSLSPPRSLASFPLTLTPVVRVLLPVNHRSRRVPGARAAAAATLAPAAVGACVAPLPRVPPSALTPHCSRVPGARRATLGLD